MLTEKNYVEAQRNVSDIFSKRRVIQTIHEVPRPFPKPIVIQNLDVRKPSTEFNEKRPIEYNVVPAAEPTASEVPTDAQVVDEFVSAPEPPEVVEDPRSILIPDPPQPHTHPAPIEMATVPELTPEPEPTLFHIEVPKRVLQPEPEPLHYQGDHDQLPSYKYPIYYKNPDLKDYVCANEYNYYAVDNQCDHFIECKVINTGIFVYYTS